jgi:hypothetical protein
LDDRQDIVEIGEEFNSGTGLVSGAMILISGVPWK